MVKDNTDHSSKKKRKRKKEEEDNTDLQLVGDNQRDNYTQSSEIMMLTEIEMGRSLLLCVGRDFSEDLVSGKHPTLKIGVKKKKRKVAESLSKIYDWFWSLFPDA